MIIVVKNFIGNLLIVWLAFMASGVSAYAHARTHAHSAHTTHHAVHETSHTHMHSHQHAAQDQHDHVDALDAADSEQASQTEQCDQSHCGHSYSIGMLMGHGTCLSIGASANMQSRPLSWAASHIAHDIERPKWPITTPAVVNLVS